MRNFRLHYRSEIRRNVLRLTIQAENQDYRVVQMNEGAGMKVWQVGDNVCLQLKNKDGVVKRYEE